jgi:dihydrouridine synthase (Dus)
MELIETCTADTPRPCKSMKVIPRICAAAKWVQNYSAAVVDINIGCPVQKVVPGGAGSAHDLSSSGHDYSGAPRRRGRAIASYRAQKTDRKPVAHCIKQGSRPGIRPFWRGIDTATIS